MSIAIVIFIVIVSVILSIVIISVSVILIVILLSLLLPLISSLICYCPKHIQGISWLEYLLGCHISRMPCVFSLCLDETLAGSDTQEQDEQEQDQGQEQ